MKILRNYEIRKYVKAFSAEEAIRLSKKSPVIEVIDMDARPKASNEPSTAAAIGFSMPPQTAE